MNFNIGDFMNFMKQSNDPQSFMLNFLDKQSQENPFFANLTNLAKNGQSDQIEKIARNMMQERGLDFDKEFTNFKNTLGLR